MKFTEARLEHAIIEGMLYGLRLRCYLLQLLMSLVMMKQTTLNDFLL